MANNLGKMHGWIVDELNRSRSTGESMHALIDECESSYAHADWSRFRKLRFDDMAPLIQWVQELFRDEPPESPLLGLWFGICTPFRNGEPVTDIYVAGAERFEPDPNDNSWAVRPKWRSESRYAHSEVLAEIYRIAHRKKGLQNDAKYPLCLGYGVFCVRDILSRLDPKLLLGKSNSMGIAVGFDSGDFVLLGKFTANGVERFK